MVHLKLKNWPKPLVFLSEEMSWTHSQAGGDSFIPDLISIKRDVAQEQRGNTLLPKDVKYRPSLSFSPLCNGYCENKLPSAVSVLFMCYSDAVCSIRAALQNLFWDSVGLTMMYYVSEITIPA